MVIDFESVLVAAELVWERARLSDRPSDTLADTMATDIEMPDAAKEKDMVKDAVDKKKPADPGDTVVADLKRNIGILEKSVQVKDLRLLTRVLRATGSIRKRMTPAILTSFVNAYVPESYESRGFILKSLDRVPALMDATVLPTKATAVPTATSSVLEVSVYLHLLSVILLIDSKSLDDALKSSKLLVDLFADHNMRTLDELKSRAYFFYARSVELTGALASIRTELLGAYRTATLQHDAASQAVLLNLLSRNYIAYNLYDQADKLLSRAPFPETRSNNQLARHLYYVGRVKAIQLDYSDALWNLQQALRKAPQQSALAFRISAQKFMIIVQLLTGEIPERAVFRQASMQAALRPYLRITQAVRAGDLANFRAVTESAASVFAADQTTSLISRLRNNVIKTGLRKLNISYSRISLAEICKRLDLGSPENAEGVVAKAIHDRVIDAVIDHEGGFVRSNETIDVYSTTEPTEAYHGRINFCLNIYNEAVRAMRFPEKQEDEETPEQRRERLKEQEELAKTLAEEEEEDDDYA